MKKKLLIIIPIIIIIAVAILFILNRHTHTFSEATCTTPQTCECGETQGDTLPHTWVDADCNTAKTCSVCSLTEGMPLEHQWLDATTEFPMTCSLCGLTEGEPLPTETTVEETTTEDSNIGTSVELEEGESQGTSTSDQRSIEEMAQQLIADYIREHTQDNQIEVDIPGGTPYDPSQDGTFEMKDFPSGAGVQIY